MRVILLNFNGKFRVIFMLGVLAGWSLFPVPVLSKEKPVILALGDSLTVGFGVKEEESYPAKLQLKIASAGFPHKVINDGGRGAAYPLVDEARTGNRHPGAGGQ